MVNKLRDVLPWPTIGRWALATLGTALIGMLGYYLHITEAQASAMSARVTKQEADVVDLRAADSAMSSRIASDAAKLDLMTKQLDRIEGLLTTLMLREGK